MLFDDSYYVSKIILALGRTFNIKAVEETVKEVIRRAKIDLCRLKTTTEENLASHNLVVLEACLRALTGLYETMKLVMKQFEVVSEVGKENLKKVRKMKVEYGEKLGPLLDKIEEFVGKIRVYAVYQRSMDVRLCVFGFYVMKQFTVYPFLRAFFNVLKTIDRQIQDYCPEEAIWCIKNFREYLETRIFTHKNIDYWEILDTKSPKTKAIYDLLWEFLGSEFTLLNQEFQNEVKMIIWIFFRKIELSNWPKDELWENLSKDSITLKKLMGIASETSYHAYFAKKQSTPTNPSPTSKPPSPSKDLKNLLDTMSWKDYCHKIIEKIESLEISEYFQHPLTKEDLGDFWDQYRWIITKPIDLSSIKSLLNEGDYTSVSMFAHDMRRMFNNCRKLYSKDMDVYQNAEQLEQMFEEMIQPVQETFGANKVLKEANIKLTVGGFDI
jgi:hypothetical protein